VSYRRGSFAEPATIADVLARFEALLEGIERLATMPVFFQRSEEAKLRLKVLSDRAGELADEVTVLLMDRSCVHKAELKVRDEERKIEREVTRIRGLRGTE